ncbi:hypothetical protein CH330_05240 [candidate division WOR-3 bacterium JGI_Cruoil_03_51_56]|uniref:PPC domain-containing protein n=1 Tax=candidate division WOR-3 bacterium JGI_Cruoil_03_51_56 TaxID=1973747 RepID=A0A235BUB3_UNCW3|nr:MAG: hypothetical protein CH330_05240 [candidate division WOR-3 bacterium JGI_Cruoil_03_51_56]
MRFIKLGPFYQLRLDRGEDIPLIITDFVKRQKIRSGIITGLGAACDVVLGYFDLKRRKYRKRRFPDEYEIASLTGNITWQGRKPFCHLHVVIANSRLTTHGGHFFSGRVSAACEVAILPGQKSIGRVEETATGLKLLDIPVKS